MVTVGTLEVRQSEEDTKKAAVATVAQSIKDESRQRARRRAADESLSNFIFSAVAVLAGIESKPDVTHHVIPSWVHRNSFGCPGNRRWTTSESKTCENGPCPRSWMRPAIDTS